MHLKRFGLWTNKDSSDFGNSAIIFLWLSLDYMEQVENQLGRIILNKQGMCRYGLEYKCD